MPAGTTSPSPSIRRNVQGADGIVAIMNSILSLAVRGLSEQLPRGTTSRRDQEEGHIAELQNVWRKYADADECQLADCYISRSRLLDAHLHLGDSSPHLPTQEPWPTQALPISPSPFQAAADIPPLSDCTDLPPTTPPHSSEALCWGQDLAQRRLSDLSSTFANSRLLCASSPTDDSIAATSSTPDSAPFPQELRHALGSTLSLESESMSLQGSPSLTPPDAPIRHMQSSPSTTEKKTQRLPSQIHMRLISAPAAFGLAIGMHKPLNPCFAVQIKLVSEQPTELNVKLGAFLLSAEQMASIETWNPYTHINAECISNGQIEQVLQCKQKSPADYADPTAMYTGVHCVTFRDMRFTTSSRMRPRWLVIAMMLPGNDVLFVQYKVPTIIMSRPCDQQQQATSILTGRLAPTKRGRCSEAEDVVAPLLQPAQGNCQHIQPMFDDSGNEAVGAFRIASAPGNMNSAFQRSALQGSAFPVQSQVVPHPMPLNSTVLVPSPPAAKRHKSLNLDSVRETSPVLHQAPGKLDNVWPDFGPYDFARWRALVLQIYDTLDLGRKLTASDIEVLCHIAGFLDLHSAAEADSMSAEQWDKFGNWYISQLRIMRDHKAAWARQEPTLICSFEVDRSAAELYLHQHCPGTFLVRPSLSLSGCVVVSTVAECGGVEHLCLAEQQLQQRKLEVWVRDAVEAQTLLDYKTGLLWAKEKVFLQQYKRLGIVVDAPAERAQQHAAIAMARSVSAHLPDVPAGLQQHDFIHGHYPLHPAQGISMQAPEGRSDDGSHRFSQHARHQCDDVLRDLLGLYTEMPSESAARAYRELPDTPEMLSHPLLPSSPPFMVPIYSGHPVMGCHAVPQRHPGGCCQAVTASNVYMGTPSRSPPKLGTPPRSPPKSHPHMGSAPRHPPYLATPPHGQSTVGDPSGSSHFMGTPLRGQSAPTHDPHTPLQITHRTPYQNQSEASTAVLHPDPFNLRHAPSSAVLNPCMMMSPALQASMRDPGITHTQDILTNMTLPEPGCLLDDDITAADMAAQWFVADPIHGCSSQDMTP